MFKQEAQQYDDLHSLSSSEDNEPHTATSKSLEKDEEILKAGSKCVTERDGVKILSKQK